MHDAERVDAVMVREFKDRQEITDVLLRYCRAADRFDMELARTCYHDDATDNHGMFVGDVPSFISYATEGLATMVCTQHHLTNVIVEVEGDAAVSDASCLAFHRMPSKDGGLADHWVGLRFVDRLERRGGPWKIARRVVVYEWSRVDPVGRQWAMDDFVRGERSRDDISYALFDELHGR